MCPNSNVLQRLFLNESRVCMPIKQNDFGGWKTLLNNQFLHIHISALWMTSTATAWPAAGACLLQTMATENLLIKRCSEHLAGWAQ